MTLMLSPCTATCGQPKCMQPCLQGHTAISSAVCAHPDAQLSRTLPALPTSKPAKPAFVGHLSTGLQVHFGVSLCSHSVDLVTQVVAAVLAAAEAEPLLKGLLRVAAVGHAGLFFVEEGVDEEVDGSFVRAFHQLIHIFKEKYI